VRHVTTPSIAASVPSTTSRGNCRHSHGLCLGRSISHGIILRLGTCLSLGVIDLACDRVLMHDRVRLSVSPARSERSCNGCRNRDEKCSSLVPDDTTECR
jgi:hypothetical protein